MSGIFMPRRAKRCSMLATIAASSISGSAEHLCDGFARQIVVGRTQAAGQHDEIDALERLPAQIAASAPVVADDGLGTQLDAERREPVGDEQRVRVEARGAEQLGADRNDFSGPKRERRFSRIHAGSEPHQQAQRDVRVNRRHRVIGHHAEAAVQLFEPAARETA